MTYRIDRWTDRGVSYAEASTKREANRIAQAMRSDRAVNQTVVVFPNGTARVCRNVVK